MSFTQVSKIRRQWIHKLARNVLEFLLLLRTLANSLAKLESQCHWVCACSENSSLQLDTGGRSLGGTGVISYSPLSRGAHRRYLHAFDGAAVDPARSRRNLPESRRRVISLNDATRSSHVCRDTLAETPLIRTADRTHTLQLQTRLDIGNHGSVTSLCLGYLADYSAL